ncbi:TetR/AcrR family transcriptional regulator [Mesorhizobium sp. CAU 1732]|uniref:TetR/AcrR family transcriptional regulator n=1 Tax=Mesorhizobium sp. CAU 1732 TaxID=3140358 RepID=UPI003260552C
MTTVANSFLVSTMKGNANLGGRPRSFDRDEAVKTAMRLFRRHGYEGVSIAMLTEAIGVAPPSLYAAFGKKADLYREALDRYAQENPVSMFSNGGQELSLAEAIDQMFRRAIRAVVNAPGAPGCMITTGLLGCHPDHSDLAKELVDRRAALCIRMSDELRQWLAEERAREAASFLCAVLQGIAVQARDGVDVAVLHTIAANARTSVAPEA